jgi:hypothetical protein
MWPRRMRTHFLGGHQRSLQNAPHKKGSSGFVGGNCQVHQILPRVVSELAESPCFFGARVSGEEAGHELLPGSGCEYQEANSALAVIGTLV